MSKVDAARYRSGPCSLNRTTEELSDRPAAEPNSTNNCCGGPGWVRTSDLPVKSRLLCQLSYGPSKVGYFGKRGQTITHPYCPKILLLYF